MPARIPSSKLPLPVNGPLPHYLMSHLQNVTSKRLATTSIPYTPMNLGIAAILLRQGFISNLTRGAPLPSSTAPLVPLQFHSVPPQAQALHLTLKYRSSQPVISRARIVSKPSSHLHVTVPELRALLTGGRIRGRAGLGMGEVAIVRTKEGRYLEGWEAVSEGVGGEVLCIVG